MELQIRFTEEFGMRRSELKFYRISSGVTERKEGSSRTNNLFIEILHLSNTVYFVF